MTVGRAAIVTSTLTGDISGDDVSLTGGAANFDTKDVGNGKTVTGVGFFLSGADAPNYNLSSSTLTTPWAHITPLDMVNGSFTGIEEGDDGGVVATIASRSLSGVLCTVHASLAGGTASFDTRNVGTGKTVTGTGFSLTGGTPATTAWRRAR